MRRALVLALLAGIASPETAWADCAADCQWYADQCATYTKLCNDTFILNPNHFTYCGQSLAYCDSHLHCMQSCTQGIATDGPRDTNGTTPIIIGFGVGGFRMTSVDDGVLFDMDADGSPELVSWTEPDSEDAFLVMDRNRNGLIDDGTELFGNSTWLFRVGKAANGFEALLEFDQQFVGGDSDGVISDGDLMYKGLMIWRDRNHNGRSEPEELQSLASAGIVTVEYAFTENQRRDRWGNQFRFKSRVWARRNGGVVPLQTYDVFLVRQ